VGVGMRRAGVVDILAGVGTARVRWGCSEKYLLPANAPLLAKDARNGAPGAVMDATR
jgi:hypothetical protein